MLTRRHRPDPLICLAAFVGLGVLVTMLYPNADGLSESGAVADAVTQPYFADDTPLIETRTATAIISRDPAI